MGDRLSDIRQYVLDRMAASLNDPLYDPAIVDRTINASNKRLGRVFDWPWLQAVGTIAFLANADTYTLTGLSNFRHIKHLAYGNQRLAYRTPAEFVRYDSQDNQQPFYYTVIGDTLCVAPTPTAAVSLDVVYTLDENDLTDDTSTCMLPAAYTELLVLATCVSLSMRSKDAARLQLVQGQYKMALDEARDEVRRTRELPRISADESLWRMI